MAVPRTRPAKQKKHYVTEKELEKIKKQVSREVTNKAMLLAMCAVADEFEATDEQICKCAARIERYCEYLDTKLAKLNDFSKAIKQSTGIDWGTF